MFTITKEFKFEASHILIGMPKNHPCGRMHGHSYVVIVELQSPKLDEKGFVKDYGDLKPIGDYLNEYYDHRHLNDVLQMNPTAEIIANVLYEKFKPEFPWLKSITVKETKSTTAKYEE